MFQLYSTGCMYALRALVFAGINSEKKPFNAKKVCQQAGIPESFTRKILQGLVKNGFMTAVPGPRGGYLLIKQPSKISVLSVIEAVDGVESYSQCVMKFDECDNKKPCAMHESWGEIKKKLLQEFQSKTVADLIRDIK